MRVAAFVGFAAVALVGCSNNPYGSGGNCSPSASQVCMISSTFSPVKTVLDLLRPEHQP